MSQCGSVPFSKVIFEQVENGNGKPLLTQVVGIYNSTFYLSSVIARYHCYMYY